MNPLAESLLRFLSDDTLQVAVLKGEWGIGKIFFWRSFLRENKEKLKFRAYSYVSLFGVHDTGDLKRQVFSNFEILDEEKLAKHLEKLKPVTRIFAAVDIPFLSS